MKPPRIAWVVFDLSNGDVGKGIGADAKNYGKWFLTRREAIRFIATQKLSTFGWTPSTVFKYVRG